MQCLLSTLLLMTAGQAPVPDALQTVAERSEYHATARYDEVVELMDAIAQRSPRVERAELGQSAEARSLPLLIVADPAVSTPEQAESSDKLVIFAFGNIHAGEVCGKEALLMLARELALPEGHPLLKDLIVVVAPILNADGNERVSKDNRPGQKGPEEGMGQRQNAEGLDLNRDYVKLESPEVRCLVRFLNRWDPAMIIDTHTTNGSYHQYTITYAAPRNPAGDAKVIEFVRNRMLPDVSRRLEADSGYESFFYGNFNKEHTEWHTYPALPRYGTPYRGLRNRIAILSEAYSYAPYRDRVLATRDFVRHCFEYAAENKKDIEKLLAGADRRAREAGRNPDPDDRVAIRNRMVQFDEPVTIAGYLEEQRDGRHVATEKTHGYRVKHYGRFEPELAVARPYAYLLPSSLEKVVEKLQTHGIEVEELREDIELDLERYTIRKIKRQERAFQQHHLVSVEVDKHSITQRVQAGTILVRTGQDLGALVVYLLEPQADDGLITWNYFDEVISEGQPFPVLRLPAKTALTSCAIRPLAENRETNKPVTFETIYESEDRPRFSGSPVSIRTWLDDGVHYLQVKDRRLWKVHAESGRCTPFDDSEKMGVALAELPVIDEATAQRMAERTSFRMDESRSAALFHHESDLYYCALDGSRALRLTRTPGVEELYEFSPNGQFVSFVRDENLYVVDIATQTERALSTDGNGEIRNGKFDWVYYEELYGRNWKAYWWSPDSRSIAFARIDDSPLHEFTVIDEIPVHQEIERTPYPKPGDPNPLVEVGVVSAAGGEIQWIDLAAYGEVGYLISRVGWTSDSDSVYLYVQNRAQTWLDFTLAKRRNGKCRTLFRETTQAWVRDQGDPHYLEDGSFILPSERTGWRHLYHFESDGKLRRQITSGEWEVRDIEHLDEKAGWIYFSGTRDSHIAHNLYRVSMDGGEPERLTTKPGHHRVHVSPEGNYFVDSHSSHRAPSKVRLCRSDGSHLRWIDTNPVYALEEYRFGKLELVQIETSGGSLLEASLMTPADFNPQEKYPVWFMTYGGPHAPTVWDSWGRRRARDYILAEMGFVVMHCDPQSASGKGAISAWSAYEQLGVQELNDIEEAIAWIRQRPYVDTARIGMSGSSYGGFMTAFAMTHSDLFAAGIATAPVTDWHNYDSIYTERYMNSPPENPDGYEDTSVVKAAGNLHGKLLIVHGVMDDNVHLQNTLQFADALQKTDKPFEMMLYPHARHGVRGTHYNRLWYDFIRRTLGEPAYPDAHLEPSKIATTAEDRSKEETAEVTTGPKTKSLKVEKSKSRN